MMFWQHRRMPAEELARDFAVTAQSFADTFIQYVAGTNFGDEAMATDVRRRETCAAVWAAINATFDASAFTEEERAKVLPIVRESLLPFWQEYCTGDCEFMSKVIERAPYYLVERDPASQLKTATAIMTTLVAAIDKETADLLPVRTLTALLAYRMLSDLRRLNEIKANYSIE